MSTSLYLTGKKKILNFCKMIEYQSTKDNYLGPRKPNKVKRDGRKFKKF